MSTYAIPDAVPRMALSMRRLSFSRIRSPPADVTTSLMPLGTPRVAPPRPRGRTSPGKERTASTNRKYMDFARRSSSTNTSLSMIRDLHLLLSQRHPGSCVDTPAFFFLVALPLFPPSMSILQGMSLPSQHSSSYPPTPDEKSASVDIPCDEKDSALDPDLDKSFSGFKDTVDEKPQYVKGEPVIANGRDVSKYLVDLRDDEDPPLTFRSAVLGTVIGGLGAALYQVRHVQCPSCSLDARVETLVCRSIFLSRSPQEPRRCFYSS